MIFIYKWNAKCSDFKNSTLRQCTISSSILIKKSILSTLKLYNTQATCIVGSVYCDIDINVNQGFVSTHVFQ